MWRGAEKKFNLTSTYVVSRQHLLVYECVLTAHVYMIHLTKIKRSKQTKICGLIKYTLLFIRKHVTSAACIANEL